MRAFDSFTADMLFTSALVSTGLIGIFAVMIIPDASRSQYYDNLIGGCGAVNTSIIGSNGILNRVAEDGVLLGSFRKPQKKYGATAWNVPACAGLRPWLKPSSNSALFTSVETSTNTGLTTSLKTNFAYIPKTIGPWSQNRHTPFRRAPHPRRSDLRNFLPSHQSNRLVRPV